MNCPDPCGPPRTTLYWVAILAYIIFAAEILTAQPAKPDRPGRIVAAYALTSAHNDEGTDPAAWQLLGSNDQGQSWKMLDQQTNQVFSGRSQRQVFAIFNRASYTIYRLQVEATGTREGVHLAELELLGKPTGVTNEVDLYSLVTASREHPLAGPASDAFDGDPKTKWRDFGGGRPGGCWIQCEYTRSTAITLTNVSQVLLSIHRADTHTALSARVPQILSNIQAQAAHAQCSLDGYALTAANDKPERDPVSWRLLGSNDNGKNWEILDSRRDELFNTRFQRRIFSLARPAKFAIYRLAIDSVRVPGVMADGNSDQLVSGANSVQLAEIEPLEGLNRAGPGFSIALSAQGENPPVESAEMLFDGNSRTKWLDYARNNTHRSSWIQWQYLRDEKTPVLNLRRLQSVRPQPPLPLDLLLEGVVVSWNSETKILGFLDETGFQLFQLGTPVAMMRPGIRIRWGGRIELNHPFPAVENPQVAVLPPLPAFAELVPGQVFDANQSFVTGVVTGNVLSVAQSPFVTTLRLQPEDRAGTFFVRVLNPAQERLHDFTGSYVRVSGVGQTVFNDEGKKVANALWVSDLTHIEETETPALRMARLHQATNQTSALPNTISTDETETVTSLGEMNSIARRTPGNPIQVKVRGVITYLDPVTEDFYLQSGNDSARVNDQISAGLSASLPMEGTYIELEGVFDAEPPAMIIPKAFVTLLGPGQMPEPLRPTRDRLMTGAEDNRWVEMEGLVREIGEHRLVLAVSGGSVLVFITRIDPQYALRLLGSQVRVSGVCLPVDNTRNQRLGVRLMVPSTQNIEVVRAAPENPFEMPNVSPQNILHADSDNRGLGLQFLKTSGVVTYQNGRLLFIQEGEAGVRVRLRQEYPVQLGDQVEVVGLAEADGPSPKLDQAAVRRVGQAVLPAAQMINLLGTELERQDATRGFLTATFLGQKTTKLGLLLEFQSEQRPQTFYAVLPTNHGVLAAIPIGSEVRLEGVFKTEADPDHHPDFDVLSTSFALYLNSPLDITILKRPSWWNARHTLWMLSGLGTILFLALVWAGLLRRQVHEQTRELHEQIEERKRMELKIKATHKELLVVSRQAGMAEVATNVLHNVGNVLNSVNVSAAIAFDRVKQSRAGGLSRAAAMLKAQASDLGTYLTLDPKGKQLPDYLEKLGDYIVEEQKLILGELDSLQKNVAHINEIVSMQQNYASVSGITEIVNLQDVLEDALRINADSFRRHGIETIRNFSTVKPITIEQHKVLQILVNLLRNAENACVESGLPDRKITIYLCQFESVFSMTITDNGVGIPAENLTRIFGHGFTTRKDGHGFGLHSGAIAAREMGGELRVESAGPGQGASFTLQLPGIRPETRRTLDLSNR